MPPECLEPGTPRDWLARARSNLILAQQPKPEGAFWEDLCFQAQQAAEKALKAVLIHYGIAFSRVHSIEALLDLMPPALDVPESLRPAAKLSDFAVMTRYPGDYPPVTEEEYTDAVRGAHTVVAWAEGMLAEVDG